MEISERNTVKVYPNPASQIVTFEVQRDAATTLRLYNVLGVEVWTTLLPKGQLAHQIDVSTLPLGVYTWTLDQENTTSGKLIIN